MNKSVKKFMRPAQLPLVINLLLLDENRRLRIALEFSFPEQNKLFIVTFKLKKKS